MLNRDPRASCGPQPSPAQKASAVRHTPGTAHARCLKAPRHGAVCRKQPPWKCLGIYGEGSRCPTADSPFQLFPRNDTRAWVLPTAGVNTRVQTTWKLLGNLGVYCRILPVFRIFEISHHKHLEARHLSSKPGACVCARAQTLESPSTGMSVCARPSSLLQLTYNPARFQQGRHTPRAVAG